MDDQAWVQAQVAKVVQATHQKRDVLIQQAVDRLPDGPYTRVEIRERGRIIEGADSMFFTWDGVDVLVMLAPVYAERDGTIEVNLRHKFLHQAA